MAAKDAHIRELQAQIALFTAQFSAGLANQGHPIRAKHRRNPSRSKINTGLGTAVCSPTEMRGLVPFLVANGNWEISNN